MPFKKISLVTLAVAAVGFFAPQAQAEQTPENITDAMNRAVFEQTGDIYRNAGIDRQATLLFGLSYPDQEYISDAQSIERVYREGMRLQTAKDNYVRTNDLPNPFTTSIGSPTR